MYGRDTALCFVHPQVGFGLYPVVVKEFAAKEKANPIIFSFYRSAAYNACVYSTVLVMFTRLKSFTLIVLLSLDK